MQDGLKMMFPKLTLEDIQDFEKTYRGSNDELRDLSRVYRESKGDMNRVVDAALCASQKDEPRIRAILQKSIDTGDLPNFKAFTSATSTRLKRNADTERQEADVRLSEIIVQVEEPRTIRQRRKARVAQFLNFVAGMEQKYCTKAPRAAPTQM